MKVKYELVVESGCPVDGLGDVYQCTLISNKPIAVETILEVVTRYKDNLIFQEELAEQLARELFCNVELVGYHSGVKVTVIA